MGLLESPEKMVVIPHYSLFNFAFGSRRVYFSLELGARALSFILEMTSEDLPSTYLFAVFVLSL
jgi:hypothetical protein